MCYVLNITCRGCSNVKKEIKLCSNIQQGLCLRNANVSNFNISINNFSKVPKLDLDSILGHMVAYRACQECLNKLVDKNKE